MRDREYILTTRISHLLDRAYGENCEASRYRTQEVSRTYNTRVSSHAETGARDNLRFQKHIHSQRTISSASVEQTLIRLGSLVVMQHRAPPPPTSTADTFLSIPECQLQWDVGALS